MAYWQAINAKAKFSGIRDAAASEGPQLIHRRKETFKVTTEQEIERRLAKRAKASARNLSAPGMLSGHHSIDAMTWTSRGLEASRVW